MRKLLIAGLVAASVATSAQAHGPSGNWVAPLIIGGVIGAAIATQPRTPYGYVPPPPPVVYHPGVVYPDYTYRPMYKFVDVYVPECNCYRTITVQIN